MKTVKDACVLAPGALEIRVSNQVEQLEQLIKAEGDGSAFFSKTYVTKGLHDLVTGGMGRLSGASNQPIFHLKQAMGGGKTHLLVALGLIAGNPALLKDDAVLRDTFPNLASNEDLTPSRIAAFNGRNTPPEFFWGALAEQLGTGKAFSRFWVAGPKAPDPSDWQELFGNEPTLILLDEMPPYFDYLASQAFAPGVAAIATRAFANLLVAAAACPRVCVVVSDLTVSYEAGRELINQALRNAADELGRQETTITPVDLATEEIYEILRKRLFTRLPGEAEISDIATAYGRALEEAAQANTASRSAEAISDEIVQTYPFHPRLKSVFALFKENENFKQTRGLLELVSRLLQSVWSRTDNDVHLIGAQHFDLSIQEVRDKLDEFSGLRDVVSRDLWDSQGEAHAQVLDLKAGNDVTTQTATLLLMASLSTAVNTVRGLTKSEMVEALVSPLRSQASDFLAAADRLEEDAWYMHHTPEGRYYFDRQENLTKMLQGFAAEAPDNQIDDLIRKRLTDMFKPRRKTVYEEVLALPRLQEVSDIIRSKRVLLIVDPDTKVPPEQIAELFSGLIAKNNLCVLTGDKTAMASVTQAARHVFASSKADVRIPSGHTQREELDRKTQEYELRFTTTILSLFDKVLFPTQRRGQPPSLISKALDQTRDTTAQFDGEEQIEKTLVVDPLKLYVEVEPHFDALREKAETLLWPEGQPVVRNEEFVRRAAEQAAMPWLPPRELDKLKAIAFSRGLWEDLGNGSMTKAPVAKQTSVQPVRISGPTDDGTAVWELNAVDAGPAPVIHFSEEGPATTKSPKLSSNQWSSKALRVSFLAVDPSGKRETGPAVEAINAPKVRNSLIERDSRRFVELLVAPVGELRYSIDGSEPRNGTIYTAQFEITDGPTTVLVHCDAEGVEVRETFFFPAASTAAGTTAPVIDGVKQARLDGGRFTFDSRASALRNIAKSAELGVTYGGVTITIGEGSNSLRLMTMGDDVRSAGSLQKVIDVLLEGAAESVPMTFKFKWAQFPTGETLQQFADECHLKLQVGEVIQ